MKKIDYKEIKYFHFMGSLCSKLQVDRLNMRVDIRLAINLDATQKSKSRNKKYAKNIFGKTRNIDRGIIVPNTKWL